LVVNLEDIPDVEVEVEVSDVEVKEEIGLILNLSLFFHKNNSKTI